MAGSSTGPGNAQRARLFPAGKTRTHWLQYVNRVWAHLLDLLSDHRSHVQWDAVPISKSSQTQMLSNSILQMPRWPSRPIHQKKTPKTGDHRPNHQQARSLQLDFQTLLPPKRQRFYPGAAKTAVRPPTLRLPRKDEEQAKREWFTSCESIGVGMVVRGLEMVDVG